jgi:hypothetical protein
MSARNLDQMTRPNLFHVEFRAGFLNERVYITDYNVYRDMQDKLDRIMLKARLYEMKRDADYVRIQKASKKNLGVLKDKDGLKKKISKLQ